jgi:hypothetical protein
VCACVRARAQELETQSTATAIAGLYKFSVKKLVKSRFGPSDNYSWSNVIFCLQNNILPPDFKASPNKICALFKRAILEFQSYLASEIIWISKHKDCLNKSIMTLWHSELFLLCVCVCVCVCIRNHGESPLNVLRLSFRIYTWRNCTVAERISMKFGIGKFY